MRTMEKPLHRSFFLNFNVELACIKFKNSV